MGGRACVDSVENTTKMRKTLRQLGGRRKSGKTPAVGDDGMRQNTWEKRLETVEKRWR